MAIKQDAAFDAFVSTAQAMLGSDLSRDWLFEIWVGADADANRALNHVLDSPEEKIRRESGGGNKSSNESKPKKSKPPKESRPPPPAPAAWDEEEYSPPPQRSQPPPPAPAPAAQPAPMQQPQQQPGYPQQQLGYPQQPAPMQYPAQTMMQPGYMMAPQHPQPMMMQQAPQMMTSQPMMMQPQQQPMMIDPMTGLPMAPMNAIQQAQTMFVQQQQQQRLMALKASIDSVLTNPVMLMNPQIMQNLQDTMILALEAPNATLQLAERARQSQQTAQFIHIMQTQVGQMLADPKVATNPALLQQLNTQMNQLRMMTMQHVAQQQIDSNPATALSLSMPLLAPPTPSAALLTRASQARLDDAFGIAQGFPVSSQREVAHESNNEDWWNTTPKASMSEKNPFREDVDTSSTTGTPTPRRLRSSMPSLAGMPVMGGGLSWMNPMPSFGYSPAMSMPALGYPQQQQITPLQLMYGSQQAGYNPLLAMQQQQLFQTPPGSMMYPSYRQF
jgi:hypothetical protein